VVRLERAWRAGYGAGVALVRGAPPTAEESAERTRAALALASDGRLRPVVGQRVPLAEAAAAHAAIEARATVGKTLLVV
jgi:NADPH:quinone reductase